MLPALSFFLSMASLQPYVIISILMAFAEIAAVIEEHCSNEDLTLPRGRRRVCNVNSQGVEWLSFCDENNYKDYSPASSCQAYVGMTLVARCQSPDAGRRLQVLRNNRIVSNTGTLVISQVQSSDTDSYECRTLLENGTIVTSFSYNVSILTGMFMILFFAAHHVAFNNTI